MFINAERYVNFLAKHKLSQPQFLLLYLIKFRKKSVMKLYMEAFPTDDGSMIGTRARQDLIDQGYLVHNVELGKGIEAYETTEKFNNIWLRDSYEAMEELWKVYPGFVNIQGRNVPLTNSDKYQLALQYAETIGHSIDEHKEVLKDVTWGVQRNLVKQNIETFVRSQVYLKIRELRLQEETNKTTEVESNEFE